MLTYTYFLKYTQVEDCSSNCIFKEELQRLATESEVEGTGHRDTQRALNRCHPFFSGLVNLSYGQKLFVLIQNGGADYRQGHFQMYNLMTKSNTRWQLVHASAAARQRVF